VEDPATSGHPLDVARPDAALVAHAVAVLDRACQNVGDRLDALGVPGKAGQIVLRPLVPEVVQEEEGS
jgi:hypothetical protein